ncbi:CRP-like cAMP-binding protein [Chitinivorax tropicus]|uniref:CRP-like cAMP-binding protein n=1 Tax=Chitinivorax tropicus TaxID=714531 RepID=A0A840MSP4_9PROT|nr:Crp/Fnr family transcriptional regulator [Chitinivorax tropicus]MBB5020435.1 CRP-like cAMP-binding protein [Chitinivorax tropicus]
MSRSKIDLHGMLSNLPLFRELAPNEINDFVAATREVRAERGTVLFRKGDPASGLWIIVYGQVKLSFPSPNGTEKVLQIFGAGQSFGEAVMFLERPAPVYAETLADSLILHLNKQTIFDALAQDPTFARRMLAGMSMRLHQLVQDVESYSLRSAAQRVIGYLLQCDHGPSAQQTTITLPATKNVIASRLSLTPETLSRIFAQLAHEELIEVNGRDIMILDVAKLQAYQ